MPVFTVHEPPPRDKDDPADAADRFVFVRDKFSMWAFLFAPFWMVWRHLWLVLFLYAVGMTLLQAGLWLIGASTVVSFAVGVLVALLIGFEGATLRRWTFARRGWINHGVVVADDEESAERRFFDAWIARDARPVAFSGQSQSSTPSPYRSAADPPAVIGLFPEPQSPPR
jgi:Protein of unknown function (DUF2628)